VKKKFFPRGRAFGKARTPDWRFARVENAVLGQYRLETAQEEQHRGMSVVRSDRPTQGRPEFRSVKTQGADSWNDLTTAGTPEFLNSKAGEILSTSPQ
jgi:hypothetical protein